MIRIIKKQSVYQKETEGYKIMGNLPPYKKNDRFSPRQKSTLFFCFLAYVITYLVRVNISVALPFMASEVGMSTTTQGFLSGAFLWCYALGQFLFGRLGDKISGKPLIFIGLLGSAFCNLTLGLLSNHTAMIFTWALNGIFQSMIWSPLVHTLSVNFQGKKLIRATAFMPFAIVMGYMLAWGLSSIYSMYFSWRTIFIIPAIVAFAFCFLFAVFFKEKEKSKSPRYINRDINIENAAYQNQTKYKSVKQNKTVLIAIIFALVCAVTHGMIRESINYWFPTLLSGMKEMSPWMSVFVLMTVPIINFFGTLVSRFLIKRTKNNIFRDIIILSAAALIFSLITVISLRFGEIPLIIFTVILLGTMFGITPLFTSFIPLHFSEYNLVGTMAGMTDAFIYFGAAFSNMLTGNLIENGGWSSVCVYWAGTAAAAFILIIICNKIKTKTDLKI